MFLFACMHSVTIGQLPLSLSREVGSRTQSSQPDHITLSLPSVSKSSVVDSFILVSELTHP